MLIADAILLAAVLFSLVTDLLERRILNMITLPMVPLGIAFHLIVHPFAWWQGAAGFAAAGGAYFLFHAIYPAGFGAGDVKLMMAIGAWATFQTSITIAIIAVVLNGLFSLVTLIYNRRLGSVVALVVRSPQRESIKIPFGVAIAIATLVGIAARDSHPPV